MLSKLRLNSERSAVRAARKRRVNLISSRCTRPVKGRSKALLGLPLSVIYCSSVSSSVIYSILLLWTKRTLAIIQAGPFVRSNATSLTLTPGRQLDLGVPRFFVSTDLCFFYPPSEPKTSILPAPPPSVPCLLLQLALHTHTNKEMGPLQFILLAL